MKDFLKSRVLNYLPARLAEQTAPPKRRRPEYLEWTSRAPLELTERFVADERLLESPLVRGLEAAFGTKRFEVLFKKWIADYGFKLFGAFENGDPLELEDAPLHRLAASFYKDRFGKAPDVRWTRPPALPLRIMGALAQAGSVLWQGLSHGVMPARERRRFTVLREANWGLKGRGRHFHDDFLVGGPISPEGLLLFSRENPVVDRELARTQARSSRYAHFDLPALKMGSDVLWDRVFRLYLLRAVPLLLRAASSPNFSLFSSVFSTFAANALPYERLFSNYSLKSELGHNLFSPSHIAEAIVCEGHGAGYFITHWSDVSINIDLFWLAYMGCDKYLVWGPAHYQGIEAPKERVEPIGFYFKDKIRAYQTSGREELRRTLGLPLGKKVVAFFDETFGGDIKMTEEHFLTFWENILAVAQAHPEAHVVLKQKGHFFHHYFSEKGRAAFDELRPKVLGLPNVTLLDPYEWSFIEAIGCADLVVTQGMTSSATIALMCGVDGLYFDQAHYDHPLARGFKDSLVFDDSAKFQKRVDGILKGTGERPTQTLPEDVLRRYDAFADDRGIERLRAILARGRA